MHLADFQRINPQQTHPHEQTCTGGGIMSSSPLLQPPAGRSKESWGQRLTGSCVAPHWPGSAHSWGSSKVLSTPVSKLQALGFLKLKFKRRKFPECLYHFWMVWLTPQLESHCCGPTGIARQGWFHTQKNRKISPTAHQLLAVRESSLRDPAVPQGVTSQGWWAWSSRAQPQPTTRPTSRVVCRFSTAADEHRRYLPGLVWV